MSALEQVLSIGSVKAEHPRLYAKAEKELAELKAQAASEVAEFNAGYEAYGHGVEYANEPIDTTHDQWRVGWAWAAFEPMRKHIAELMATLAAYGDAEPPNGQPITLTTRQCIACHAAAEKMREAAANRVNSITKARIPEPFRNSDFYIGLNESDDGWRDLSQLEMRLLSGVVDLIRALPLPDCSACNPIAPDDIDTCGACKNFKRCESLFGCKPDDTECDWYPSRFERVAQP